MKGRAARGRLPLAGQLLATGARALLAEVAK
jgi:hypothetical protein